MVLEKSILDFDQYQGSETASQCRQALEQRFTGKMSEKEFDEYMAFLNIPNLNAFRF